MCNFLSSPAVKTESSLESREIANELSRVRKSARRSGLSRARHYVLRSTFIYRKLITGLSIILIYIGGVYANDVIT